MRYLPSVPAWTTPINVLAALQRGQAVHAGDMRGILIGVTKSGTVVVAWRCALARKPDPIAYLAGLARYVRANKAPRGNAREALAFLTAQRRPAPHIPDAARIGQALQNYRHASNMEQRTRRLGLPENARFYREQAKAALSDFVETFGF